MVWIEHDLQDGIVLAKTLEIFVVEKDSDSVQYVAGNFKRGLYRNSERITKSKQAYNCNYTSDNFFNDGEITIKEEFAPTLKKKIVQL